MIQVMFDQEDDSELNDDEWLTEDERLTRFRKTRDKIVGRVKVSESPYVQGPKYSDKYLEVRDRVPSSTEKPSFREPSTDGNHVPVGQAQNNGSSDSQETPVSIANVRPEGTEDKSVTFPSGEAL